MTIDIRVGGVWVKRLGYCGPVTYSTRWPVGCWDASWEMDLDPNFTHPVLIPGALVELFAGPLRIWVGELDEPARGEPWELSAQGIGRAARRFLAVDATLKPTTVAQDAVDQAILRGLPWARYDTMPGGTTALTAAAESMTMSRLPDILDGWADTQALKWGVFGDGVLTWGADDTSPSWAMTPGRAIMATSDEDYASHIFGRYVSAVAGTPPVPSAWATVIATADAPLGRYEVPVDLTGRGLMAALKAQGVVAGVLARIGARMGWATAVEPARYTLTSIGGVPAPFELVQARQCLRIYGVLDSQGNPAFGQAVDVALGEVRYTDGDESIYLAPVGLAPRDLASVIEAATQPADPSVLIE